MAENRTVVATRAEVAAQALTDYWEPMRGYKELYLETELGQAEFVLDALNKHDRDRNIIRVIANERTVHYVACQLAAVKYPERMWEQLLPSAQEALKTTAQILLTTLSTMDKGES